MRTLGHYRRTLFSSLIAELIPNASRHVKEAFWLIPTAEVPLTNLVREQILEKQLLALHRLHAVLPRRSGRGGQGDARHDPPAPILQSELVSIAHPEKSGKSMSA